MIPNEFCIIKNRMHCPCSSSSLPETVHIQGDFPSPEPSNIAARYLVTLCAMRVSASLLAPVTRWMPSNQPARRATTTFDIFSGIAGKKKKKHHQNTSLRPLGLPTVLSQCLTSPLQDLADKHRHENPRYGPKEGGPGTSSWAPPPGTKFFSSGISNRIGM
jgi:hypothetical protein